ncbi:MAG: metallophosphoesterase family protein, partial [Planctomycetes bacterium]|nr:metallophosphoesterase family protein [Planctomycetota bacterium]
KPKAIVGNHDLSALARRGRPKALSCPVNWEDWTSAQLSTAQCEYLGSLPRELRLESCGCEARVIHHPAGAPYLHPHMPDEMLAEFFRDVPGRVVCFGHSHRRIDRVIRGRRFVCVPSVGEPRNGDSRAGYAVEEDGQIYFKFVSYAAQPLIRDIQAIGLDERFCERWVRFVLTARDPEWSREYPPSNTRKGTA